MDENPTGDHTSSLGNPSEYPKSQPRDLHPTSDIRFVMVEVGKLSANVERLITDVSSQGKKIDAVQHQVSFVKGAIWVAGVVLGLIVIISGWYLTGRFSALFDAIGKITK